MCKTAVTDEALMVRTQDDDGLAFAELYVRHAVHAMELASRICADTDRAEEAVQDGFLSIWRSRAEYRPQLGTFEAWSLRIVHNRAIDSARLVRIRPPLQGADRGGESDAEDDADSTFEHAVTGLDHKRLFEALRRIPIRQAEVILLAYYGDLSLSLIATRLEVSIGTVKGRMRLGLEKLRGEWPARERRDALNDPVGPRTTHPF